MNCSKSEWQIMKIIWDKEQATAKEILAEADEDWTSSTIRTMLSRLVKKGLLAYTHNKNEYVYYSNVPKEEVIEKESASFFKKLYGGALKSALVNFIEAETLSKEDKEELTKLLEEK